MNLRQNTNSLKLVKINDLPRIQNEVEIFEPQRGEHIYPEFEHTFSFKGQKYCMLVCFLYDSSEVLQVHVEAVWNYDTEFCLQLPDDIVTLAYADKIAHEVCQQLWTELRQDFYFGCR